MSQLSMPRDTRAGTADRRARPTPPGARVGQRAIAVLAGVVAALVLIVLIVLGSRGFRWFDAALIGYAVGVVFATAAITYKYTFWLMRPQTGRYFRRGWQLFLSLENFRHYATLVPSAIVKGLLAQTFIRKRSLYRWITHLCIFWGVIFSLCITLPLTFGWLRFTQTATGEYRIWVLGFALFTFGPYSVLGFLIYHALVLSSLLLLVGLVLAFHRRFHDVANIAVQRFGFDIVPLALLFAIVLTGVALTADSAFFNGTYYWFISLTHEAVVVLWLISLPFGKFFHIIERPATVGIELYWRVSEDSAQAHCPRCGNAFAPLRFMTDLKLTLSEIGQQYAIQPGQPAPSTPGDASQSPTQQVWWQDFCPDCKRVLRGEANLAALGRDGNQFL